MSNIKSKEDITSLKESGKILKITLDAISDLIKSGVKLSFLDSQARHIIHSYNAKPSFLGYRPEGSEKPFPASICTSLNSVVVHGIPDNTVLQSGDVLKIDIGVDYRGYFTDASRTIIVDNRASPAVKKLIKATKEALYCGITEARIGNKIGDIGFVISAIAKKYNVSVIEGLAGHGLGFAPHEDPLIFNFGKKNTGMLIKEGMVFALEPMFSLGSPKIHQRLDGSYQTIDNSITAHFEHTIVVLETGAHILTE